ncbi:hypothetical protein So717_36470 [Roseobacter cerasinus]|uniref:Uncharacterized protein n=1 Tax=Roseobacter cerasinus TaxID=2602289 RepID=A0A640VWA9_9RHOB|nr:hypothetical protein [Roseobacter cerasinus]GFE51894.1 hypothetical protein So717_36470 [Roseobacter cerasinus]
MSLSEPDPLDLFLQAHLNGVREAERCLGIVEKQLSDIGPDGLLLGCKAALLIIVQTDAGLAVNDLLYRRNALQIARDALHRADQSTALKIQLINGLAWARLGPGDSDHAQAHEFLRAFEISASSTDFPPLLALEAQVALCLIHEDAGAPELGATCFEQACRIDGPQAEARLAALLTLRRRARRR